MLEINKKNAYTRLWKEKKSNNILTINNILIFFFIVKIKKYMKTILVQVIYIKSIKILSKSAQIIENNIVQIIINILFSLIKIKKDHLLYQIIYKACFHFYYLKPFLIINIIMIFNNLSII